MLNNSQTTNNAVGLSSHSPTTKRSSRFTKMHQKRKVMNHSSSYERPMKK